MRRDLAVAVAVAAGAVVFGGASAASADAGAQSVPTHIPVNACGNTVSIIGLLNPSFGNTCINA
ncbi:chaplin [Streptomyces sp. A0592]|uniref:chaplin n=1 Tax=Streptomyces sp. A0592 TaxID=2563099 RepID=UPI00109EE01A|nr:chaplin [Streptomyces sp. A0592]THA77812.1 chaplin [Streptomyces sp. A0592]